jgi:hypothetical protein
MLAKKLSVLKFSNISFEKNIELYLSATNITIHTRCYVNVPRYGVMASAVIIW